MRLRQILATWMAWAAWTAPAAADPAPARVESVAGGRWSPSLGFVSAGQLPPSEPGGDARLSVVDVPPPAAAPPVQDTGGGSAGPAADADEPNESIGAVYFGIGSLGLEPEQPAAEDGQQPLRLEETSGLELAMGLKWILVGKSVGGTIGLGLSMSFAELEVTDENRQEKKYSVFAAPVWLRGGPDMHVARFLDLGPRVGAQVGPYSLKPAEDDTSSSSSSSGTGSGQSAFSFYYEYGAVARLRFGKFIIEPGMVWRNSSDVSGQYLTANAMLGLGFIHLIGWWESRMSTSGETTTTSTSEAVAGGMPEASRIGAGIAFSML